MPIDVSIHARAWRATTAARTSRSPWRFNSRPRVAGDRRLGGHFQGARVSIHARAWRATPCAMRVSRSRNVSIHARAWRATLRPILPPLPAAVSIHARAWRATSRVRNVCRHEWFQFTPARGGRHSSRDGGPAMMGFNSRPRVAGDVRLPRLRADERVSIHARAWRATPPPAWHSRTRRFNSRPRVAGDLAQLVYDTVPRGFNSRPRVAGDIAYISHGKNAHSFNSRPRVAGDTNVIRNVDSSGGFNSRPRVAGDTPTESKVTIAVCFNSRPRVAGDWRVPGPCSRSRVSIHARAWRATSRPACSRSPACFNSRPRVAGDQRGNPGVLQ